MLSSLSGTSLLYSLYCSFLFNKFTFVRNKNDRELHLTLSKIGIYHPPSIACASPRYLAYAEKKKKIYWYVGILFIVSRPKNEKLEKEP